MAKMKIGDVADKLDVTVDIEDNDMITDLIVIAKIVDESGVPNVSIGRSESTSGLDQFALVKAADAIVTADGWIRRDEDDTI